MAAADASKLYSTYKTYLMLGTPGTGSTISYEKLCDVNNYPDLGSAPELIDMTSLSDSSRKGVQGIQQQDSLSFEVNYNPTVYSTIKALDDGEAHDFGVYFGGTESSGVVTPSGDDGKWLFKAFCSIMVNSGDVNAGRKMTVTLTPTTGFTFSAAS